jgi:hypothetical protein
MFLTRAPVPVAVLYTPIVSAYSAFTLEATLSLPVEYEYSALAPMPVLLEPVGGALISPVPKRASYPAAVLPLPVTL